MDREKQKEKARKRRNHKFRIREKGRQYAKHVYGYSEREYIYYGRIFFSPREEERTRAEEIKKLAEREARMAETRPRCSCTMCGNPRRHYKARTFVEFRQKDFIKVQLEEAGIHLSQVRDLCRFLQKRKINW